MKILIVDDEENMRHLISMYIHNAGYETIEAENADEAYQHLANDQVSLIILDIMLPGQSGYEICQTIRTFSEVPIIFLTAKGEEWDKVKGLKLGGDDYIVKPFSPGELIARIEAVLRRIKSPVENKNTPLIYGPFTLLCEQRKLLVDNEEVQLTYKEFELATLFIEYPERVFTREHLLDRVWDRAYEGSLRTVDTHIKTLRMKLGESNGKYIQTVRGVGYKLGDPQ